MLSRLAESAFWLGRYLERTEGLSRLLLEFHQILIQDQPSHISRGCALLTHGLGLDLTAHTAHTLIEIVSGTDSNPSTIRGALHGARANARSIRDTLPSDFYESMNLMQASLANFDSHSPGSSLRNILDRLAVANGIHEWLAPRDESSHFFTLGRSLERMDLMSRLLSLKIENEWRDQGPATTLRAVGGLSTFLRAKIPITSTNVRHFLITDTSFPRPLSESGRMAESSLREIARINGISAENILKPIGLLASQILFMGGDPTAQEEIILQVPEAVKKTSQLISTHFFRPIGSIVWSN